MSNNFHCIKYMRLCIFFAIFLAPTHAFSATYSATVTPIRVGVWTTSSTDANWNSGDKIAVRLSAAFPWSNCSYNQVWFDGTTPQGKNLLSLFMTAIVINKNVNITVRDDTKTGSVCEAIAIETQ